MIIAILAIFYSAVKWAKISSNVKAFIHIESIAFQLEIENEKQKLLISNLEIKNNYDLIVSHTHELNKVADELISSIEDTKEPTLLQLLEELKLKRVVLEDIYKDIKTTNIQIKDSLQWLSNFYQQHLDQKNNPQLFSYIFHILDKSKENQISTIQPYNINSHDPSYDQLKKHLQTLYVASEKLILLKEKLQKNDISTDTGKLTHYLDSSLTEFRKEGMFIVSVLLLSVLFLIFFGMIVYIKEIRLTLSAASLKNELQRFVDALNQSAIVSKSDLEGNITYVNKKFCEISGYTQEELIGKNHNIIRHPDTPSEIFKELWDTIESKKTFKTTIKNLTKDGGYYYVDSVILPLLDLNNEIVEYLAVRYDVTELVKTRDAAILAEKAKGEFLSNMSHELRTPLNAINGFSTILQRELSDEKHLAYIKSILDSSDNLIGLIGDILDLSKLQSGKFVLDYHHFNIQKKMQQFIVRFDAQLKLLELNIVLNIDETTDVTVSGDWLRISQIITNLISNALKFTPMGGEIELRCHYEDGVLKIIVKDNGIGISSEVQSKIFQPFEQADTSTTRKYGGTGLGLSIVFNLVEQMDGEITLDSQEGKGSEFSVKIPLKEVKGSHNDLADDEQTDTREKLHGHLLIAEDNKTNQMLIGIIVEEFGLTYTMANDGVEAVDLFAKERFDLVLMDENMPNMNGTQAVKKIHDLYGTDVPIVALTANVMSGDKEKFLEAGMDAYVAKPIDEGELYKVLKSFLDTKA